MRRRAIYAECGMGRLLERCANEVLGETRGDNEHLNEAAKEAAVLLLRKVPNVVVRHPRCVMLLTDSVGHERRALLQVSNDETAALARAKYSAEMALLRMTQR